MEIKATKDILEQLEIHDVDLTDAKEFYDERDGYPRLALKVISQTDIPGITAKDKDCYTAVVVLNTGNMNDLLELFISERIAGNRGNRGPRDDIFNAKLRMWHQSLKRKYIEVMKVKAFSPKISRIDNSTNTSSIPDNPTPDTPIIEGKAPRLKRRKKGPTL